MENKYKLDMKDRRILSELDKDARQSFSQIAKKVGLSTEVVNYRIKRLEEENVITQYQLIVNLAKLGVLQFKLCLSLQNTTSDSLNKIIIELKKNNAIKWIVSCEGSWDLIMSVEVESIEEIDSVKTEILKLFHGKIAEKALSILVEAAVYNRKYFLEEKKSKEALIMKNEEKTVIDDIDLSILRSLSKNARKSITEIASELKLSERIINYRIKQMVKEKIIVGYKIAINYEKLGIKFYKTFIYVSPSEEVSSESILKFLELNKSLIHQVKVLGNWDLEPEFECNSEEDFREIIKNLKDKFPGNIKKIDVIAITKEHKFVYF